MPVNQIKRGTAIDFRGKIWVIHSYSHHSQGRGGAHYKLDLRDLVGNGKLTERFNSGSNVEVVELETKTYQFLYTDTEIHLLDPTTFETHAFPLSIINAGEKVIPFLQDSMELRVDSHESTPVVIKVPERGTYTVVECDPSPSTATNEGKGTSFKQAKLDVGAHVQVPEFVNLGDKVVVDLLDQRYVSRAK
ncbi:hypothetical protein HDU85_004734 [Gaertneriomyces sp. JEL0708]|nr:hypothetical protein HDU85_004734 [Gaertneriomyces sp. JEL0708]